MLPVLPSTPAAPAVLGGNLEELGRSLWESECKMTGLFPPWTVTLKVDERSSRLHFSSSKWAAVIREDSLPAPPPLSRTSPRGLHFFDFRSGGGESLLAGCFSYSFTSSHPHLMLCHAVDLLVSPFGRWEMFHLR